MTQPAVVAVVSLTAYTGSLGRGNFRRRAETVSLTSRGTIHGGISMRWIRKLIFGWHESEIERLESCITRLMQSELTLRRKIADAHRLVVQLTEEIR